MSVLDLLRTPGKGEPPDSLDAPDDPRTQPYPGQYRGTPFMSEHGWGPLGFRPWPVRYRSDFPDRHTFQFSGMVTESYPGQQKRNGVGQIGAGLWNVPSKGDVPYWQSTTRTNPPPVTRFGGPGQIPMGPVGVFQQSAASSAGKPLVASGVGTVYAPLLGGWAAS